MLFSDSYFTIATPANAQIKEKGSKFLAYAFPVRTEADIKQQLTALKKEHPSANHHCYAWRLGADKAAFRSNDDGEPANSAGKPILGQIQAKDLTNILIVVVRYFGGTLLGVGGLISTYRASATEVLNACKIEEQFILYQYKVEYDFDVLSPVMRLLKDYEAKILSTTYTEKNEIVFQVKKMFSEKLENEFAQLYTTRLKFLNLI
jgi:uncharacterized YigZ family protein